jgi:hypothetical protein
VLGKRTACGGEWWRSVAWTYQKGGNGEASKQNREEERRLKNKE